MTKPTTHVLFVVDMPFQAQSATAVAWAAGLFEGEGSIGPRRPYGATGYMRGARLQLGMTDRDVVDRFASVVGCGKIRLMPREAPHNSLWVWDCTNWANILAVVDLLSPWFGARRSAAVTQLLSNPPVWHRGQGCPREPVVGGGGYERHRRRGEKPCDICTESRRLAYRNRQARKAEGLPLEGRWAKQRRTS